MRIPDTKLLLPQLTPISRETLPHNLKLGQILRATVLSENLNGILKLQIGGTKVIAQTQLAATPGQTLTLQVDKAGALPELKLVALTSMQEIHTQAMKSVLPRQRPLSELFVNLLDVNRSPVSNTTSGEIKQAIHSLISQLLSTQHPKFSEVFKSALLDSGLLTERHLLNDTLPSSDLKLNLLKLFDLVKSLLPSQHSGSGKETVSNNAALDSATPQAETSFKHLSELLKQLDGALARVQTNQLASLPQDESSRQVWQFELPLLHKDQVDLLQITVNKDGDRSQDDPTAVWNLTLQMNLQTLGPMRVQLRLQDKALATVIWSEQPDTTKLVESHLVKLQQAFEQAGLEVTRLQAYQTKIEERDLVPRDTSLLSEKA